MATYGALDDSPPVSGAAASDAQRHGNAPSNEKIRNCECLHLSRKSSVPQIYFIVSLAIPPLILLYVYMDSALANGFIIAGLFGLFTTIFATTYFRRFFNLQGEIDHLHKSVTSFRYERRNLEKEIGTLHRGHEALLNIRDTLHKNNLQIMDMNHKFEEINNSLQGMNVDSIESMQFLKDRLDGIKERYYQISLQKQREFLWAVFERLKTTYGVEQINEETYTGFYDMVPVEYQTRLDRLGGFEYLLSLVPENPNRYIDVATFEAGLDVWAQMQVENCDIEFKVIKQVSGMNEVQILSRTKTFGPYVDADELGVFRSIGSWAGTPRNFDDDGISSPSFASPLGMKRKNETPTKPSPLDNLYQ